MGSLDWVNEKCESQTESSRLKEWKNKLST